MGLGTVACISLSGVEVGICITAWATTEEVSIGATGQRVISISA